MVGDLATCFPLQAGIKTRPNTCERFLVHRKMNKNAPYNYIIYLPLDMGRKFHLALNYNIDRLSNRRK